MADKPAPPIPTRAMPLLEFHRTLLADEAAQNAFRQAILEIVQGGETVLDLGTGTGIHAIFACQAGARAVHAVDQSPIIGLARLVCEVNGFADRITFHHGAAQDLVLPERVDVITAHLGLSDTLAILPDARVKHLRPGGVVIPAAIDLFCAPLESAETYDQVRFWGESRYGLDFTPIRYFATRSQYACRIATSELLGHGTHLAAFDFSASVDRLAAWAECDILRDGTLHGIGMWYLERLSPQVTISTAPPTSLPRNLWPNHFFTCEPPARVRRGDTVAVRFRAGAALATDWSWEIEVRAPGRDALHLHAWGGAPP
jgi:2-polyprenyl-3-methyl-5-hydroxy-6-metoxy-1,4-benzoquinol methylase